MQRHVAHSASKCNVVQNDPDLCELLSLCKTVHCLHGFVNKSACGLDISWRAIADGARPSAVTRR